MDRLRRSIRQSLRRRHSPELHLPTEVVAPTTGNGCKQWQPDEGAVRAGLCNFNVKYLGSVEVFESRGMQVCEGALKILRSSRRRPVKAILYVSGDGLRVVDQENNRGLIVDQTIEKVSFCAPDRNNDKGFAYICRDGTSRRWMCHGFHTMKESGERLSHAVGCAFSICLEKKKKRDEEGIQSIERALNPNWDDKSSGLPSTSTLDGGALKNQSYQSFRKQISISERLQDPQSAIVNSAPSLASPLTSTGIATPRPQSNPALLQRNGSLRIPEASAALFKRNYSLRSIVSNVERSPIKKVRDTQMIQNEPIYEGEEEPLNLSISCKKENSYNTNLVPTKSMSKDVSSSSHVPNNTFMETRSLWNTFDGSFPQSRSLSNGFSTLNKKDEQQFSNISGCSPMSVLVPQSTRSKADEWLEDALRTSLSLSSPPLSASKESPVEINTSACAADIRQSVMVQGWEAPKLSSTVVHSQNKSQMNEQLQSYVPPIPVKNAVACSSSTTSVDAFGHSVLWQTAPTIPISKPDDPFDVQWCRLTVSTANDLKSDSFSPSLVGRKVTILDNG